MTKSIFTPKVRRIFDLLNSGGARDVLLVGGCVRDWLLGVESKDIDLEVYGLSYEKIAEILSPHFRVEQVGKSFGVLKVGHDIDVALPRTESKAGTGHTGFDVVSDPYLDPKGAFARRDFTINALGMRADGQIVDFYGGQRDLDKKILRAVSAAFKDDPLRVLRGMQFASRFGMTLDEKTTEYCRELLPEFATLSEERIYEEWHKWATKGVYPSRGLEVLRQTGWITCFSELSALNGCEQNPKWHPEGDVWEHTKLVTDQMAGLIRASGQSGDETSEPFSDEERTILMFAALCHDFGKPSVSVRDTDGTIRSHGHAEVGVPLAEAFLRRMKAPIRIIETVKPLVAEHMAILNTQKLGVPSPRTVRRLAVRLAPATIRHWCALCQADALGCFSPACDQKLIRFETDVWLNAAENASVRDEQPKPILLGRHLIELGWESGPMMGKTLDAAFEAQLDGAFDSVETALVWLKENIHQER